MATAGLRCLLAPAVAALLLFASAHGERRGAGAPHVALEREGRGGGAAVAVARRPHGGLRRRGLFSIAALALSSGSPLPASAEEENKETVEQTHKRQFFDKIDTNNDGKVDKAEYIAVAHRALEDRDAVDEEMRQRLEDFYVRLFDTADMDGDGFLEEREVEYAEHLHVHAADLRMGKEEGMLPDDDSDEFGLNHFDPLIKEADLNADGVIDKDEWTKAMQQTAIRWGIDGYLEDPQVTGWLEELFGKADVNADGIMNRKEVQYTSFLADEDFRIGLFAAQQWANELLSELDKNADAKLDMEEIKEGLETAGEGAPRWKKVLSKLSDFFAEADLDNDGALDRKEMAKLASKVFGEEL